MMQDIQMAVSLRALLIQKDVKPNHAYIPLTDSLRALLIQKDVKHFLKYL